MILLSSTPEKDQAMSAPDAFFHYLPVDEETMAQGMYVTGGGRATIQPGEKYPPSGHPPLYQFEWLRGRTLPEYQLLLITGGEGEFESEATGSVELCDSTLLILFPGVWHRYRPKVAVGWTERWFSFNGEAIQQLLDTRHFGPRNAVSRPQDAMLLAEAFDDLLEGIRLRSVGDSFRLNFQALRIISEAVSQQIAGSLGAADVSDRLAAHRDDPVVQRALEIIWTHSPFPTSVNDIARQLPVTRRTLDRRFADATGHSVLEEINACRLSRAKRLLTETDLPVKSVAHLAGFSSTERMRVLFVEREGVSPNSYRKQTSHPRPSRDENR
jgi:AraC-like DNA-binding protein